MKFIKGVLLSLALVCILTGCSKLVNVESLLPKKSFDKICTIKDIELGDNEYVDMAVGLEKKSGAIVFNYALLMHGKDGEPIKIADDYDEEKALKEITDTFTSEYETDDAKAEIKNGSIRISFSTENDYYGEDVSKVVDDLVASDFICK